MVVAFCRAVHQYQLSTNSLCCCPLSGFYMSHSGCFGARSIERCSCCWRHGAGGAAAACQQACAGRMECAYEQAVWCNLFSPHVHKVDRDLWPGRHKLTSLDRGPSWVPRAVRLRQRRLSKNWVLGLCLAAAAAPAFLQTMPAASAVGFEASRSPLLHGVRQEQWVAARGRARKHGATPPNIDHCKPDHTVTHTGRCVPRQCRLPPALRKGSNAAAAARRTRV